MRSLIHFVAAASLALGGWAMTGCEETPQPQGENSTTAGGTGEFGENPARPGSYQANPSYQSTPITPVAPTTQPSTPNYSEPGQPSGGQRDNFNGQSNFESKDQPSIPQTPANNNSQDSKDQVNNPSAADTGNTDEESATPSSSDQASPANPDKGNAANPSANDENNRNPDED